MITGDYKLGCQYRDLILEQIKKELKPSDEDLQLMKDRLNLVKKILLQWKML